MAEKSKERRAEVAADGTPEPPGAQDQSRKRQNIATNAVIHATALWDAIQALELLRQERGQAGNFVDADFTESDLIHLTPFMIGSLLDTITPELKTAIEGGSVGANAARKDILLQVRR